MINKQTMCLVVGKVYLPLILAAVSVTPILYGAGTVTVCDEPNLRAALVGGGTVTFAVSGTIQLTNTLVITNATTIDASGYSVTISGNNAVRILSVNPGVTASFVNLGLVNGFHAGSNGVAGPPVTDGQPGIGAAILNNGGTVILTGCSFTSNRVAGGAGRLGPTQSPGSSGGSALGAALWNQAGSAYVTNCSFSANGCTGGSGGVGNVLSGTPPGGGTAAGGAIGSIDGNVIVHNSSFSFNTTQGGAPGDPTSPSPGRGGSGFGGAFWGSNSVASFYSSTFTSNSATGASLGNTFNGGFAGGPGSALGGAIFVTNGVANGDSCSFRTNLALAGHRTVNGALASARGGAICNYAQLTFSRSSFSGNQAVGNGVGGSTLMSGAEPAGDGSGGAIFNGNTLSLSASLLCGNSAQGGQGGLISQYGGYGGHGQGGAIWNQATLNVTNCTFISNTSIGGSGGPMTGVTEGGRGVGGGLCHSNGTANLVNVTFALNSVIGGNGANGGSNGVASGWAIYTDSGTVNLLNSILANSSPGTNSSGILTDLGYNLSSDGSCGFAGPGSLNNTDPVLGPLANYGGPTLTMALLTGSPAIDGANPSVFPPTDQRGRARPFGAGPDMGAFESSPPYVIRGAITGATLTEEVSVDDGLGIVSTTNRSYSLEGLGSGVYAVTPQSLHYLFVPNQRSITVGPDRVGVNFSAYRWNMLSLDEVTNGSLHVVYAGTNGHTYRLQTSPDLRVWSTVSTNTIGSSNYSDLLLLIGTESAKYYRTITP